MVQEEEEREKEKRRGEAEAEAEVEAEANLKEEREGPMVDAIILTMSQLALYVFVEISV